MDGTTRAFVLLAFIFFIWTVRRTPPGRVRHAINRLSVIGAFVSLGMWIGCCAIEASAYILPFEGWISGFFGWLFIFCVIYSRTKPLPAKPPAPDPAPDPAPPPESS